MLNTQLTISLYSPLLANTTEQEQVKPLASQNDIDAIHTWLNEYNNNINTLNSYRQTVERFIYYIDDFNIGLKQINREIIQKYEKFLKDPQPQIKWCTGKARYQRHHPEWKPFVKGLSASSINLNIQILSNMFQYLVYSDYLSKNPFKLVKTKRKVITTQERYLNSEHIQILFDYLQTPPQEIDELLKQRRIWLFTLLFLTGMRKSEVANAKMSNFHYESGEWWLYVIGKGNKEAKIPVTPQLYSALQTYRLAMGIQPQPSPTETDLGLIISPKLNNKLKSLSEKSIYNIVKDTFKEIGTWLEVGDPQLAYKFNLATTHWMRHTSATQQTQAGIPLEQVQANLRHSEISTTMRYVHTEDGIRHQELSEKLKI